MKAFLTKDAKHLILLLILVVLTVLLCIPTVNNTFIGVFGFLAYFYLALGYICLILSWKKIKLEVDNKTKVLAVITYFFIIATIHTALCGRAMTNIDFGTYVTGAYETKTVGGVIFSLLTSPVVLPLKYVVSIIIFFIGAAVSSFFILKSFIFVSDKKAVKKTVKNALSEEKTLYNESLTVQHEPSTNLSLPIVKKKAEKKQTVSEKPSSAREILFGNIENNVFDDIDIKSKTYGTEKYVFDANNSKKADLTEGFEQYLPLDKQKLVSKQNASKKLFGGIDDDIVVAEKVPTIGADIEETMGYNPYIPTETIFSNEKSTNRENSLNVPEESVDVLPVMKDSRFAQAARQEGGLDAPKPITIEDKASEKYKKEKPIHIEKAEEKKGTGGIFGNKKAMIYQKPPLDILTEHPSPNYSPYVENYEELKEVFEEKLKHYNIDVKLVKAIKGPTITICVLDLSEKCPISKVYSAKMDIQRLLHSQKEINIIPQIGDSAYFGIEIPNKVTATVSFKEIISSPDYINAKGDIVLALGKTADGKTLIDDLGAMPHALIAGTTGSGKSVCINVILASILYRYSPDEIKLILIDLKTVEMAPYANLPHMLFNNPLSDITQITNALKWARKETMRRFGVFKGFNCRNLKEYNASLPKQERLPRIVIIIDEASELMTDPKSGKTMDATLCSLARMARAAGIHLLFATQNPVKEVITNEIQNNLNTKIAFKVGDYNHSMVIFKAKGAETLLGRGDMYIKKGTDMQRAQCAYIDTKEIEAMVDYIKAKNPVEFDYFAIDKILNGDKEQAVVEEIKNTTAASGVYVKKDLDNDEAFQSLLREGLRICLETGKISTSLLQREMSKGFNSIARVVDYMEKKGYISAPYSGNKRNIIITKDMFNEMYPEVPIE